MERYYCVFSGNHMNSFGFGSIQSNLITEPESLKEETSQIIIPDLNHLHFSLSLNVNGKQIICTKYPHLSQVISESIMNAAIWRSLGYSTEIIPSEVTNFGNIIKIKLVDKVFDHRQIEDLKKSSLYKIVVLKAVHTNIRINDIRLLSKYDGTISARQLLTKHLNYLMLCSYVQLQARAPLAFSFSSRIKYTASFEFITSLVSSFTKSSQTSIIDARAINAGFLLQTINRDFAGYTKTLTKSQRKRFKAERWLILQFFSEFET